MENHRKQELRLQAQEVDAAFLLVLPVVLQIVKRWGVTKGRILSTDPMLADEMRMALCISGAIAIGPSAEADNASVAIGPETICHGGRVSIDVDWVCDELRRIYGGGRV